jgi:hypothetical protein
MSFNYYNRLLKVGSPLGLPTPKVGIHLQMWGSFPHTLSYILGSMKCDSQASLFACTFTNPCFGHEPKAMVATKIVAS